MLYIFVALTPILRRNSSPTQGIAIVKLVGLQNKSLVLVQVHLLWRSSIHMALKSSIQQFAC